jgi:hypothetical protein
LFGIAWIYLALGAAPEGWRGSRQPGSGARLTFADLCRFWANAAYYR